jgi:hypothetical protein
MFYIFSIGIAAFFLTQDTQAQCVSKRVENMCNVVFQVQDKITKSTVNVSRTYDLQLLSIDHCDHFCRIFEETLNRLNASHKAQENTPSDPMTSNAIETLDPQVESPEHAGLTNTTFLYGVYNGNLDLTESAGAFDDLIQFALMKKGNRNIDVGGGRYNHGSAFLELFGVKNEVFDPFGRSQKHNNRVLEQDSFDTATSISILNVILSAKERLEHIQLIHNKLKPGGIAFFKVYEGDKSGSASRFQLNQKTAFYLKEIQCIFGNEVEFKEHHHLIIAKKPAAF